MKRRHVLAAAAVFALLPTFGCPGPEPSASPSPSGASGTEESAGASESTGAHDGPSDPESTGGSTGETAASSTGESSDAGTSTGDSDVVPCAAGALADEPPSPTGAFTLLPGELYVVYSELRQTDQPDYSETSNMFLFRGVDVDGEPSVWIFGTGYGAGAALQYFPYPRTVQYPGRTPVLDAADADHVITSCLGLPRESVRLNLLAPHFHFDHFNYDFLGALLDHGYAASNVELMVHVNDFDAAFCGDACIDTPQLGGSLPPFPPDLVASAQAIGALDDVCGELIFTIETASLGVLDVVATPDHTAGSISLRSDDLGIGFEGSKSISCMPPSELSPLLQHGSVAAAWPF